MGATMSDDSPSVAPAVRAPGLFKLLLEARAPLEYAASLAAAPWLLSAPRGDGHPVMVYPGFLASDLSTRPLRRLLQTLGHDVTGWRQGRNLGPRGDTMEQALQQIRFQHGRGGRKVSLVGWSLGGLYARELAKRAPEAVRCVVTLGSPFAGPRRANNAWRTYEWLHRHRPETPSDEYEDLLRPPPVPTTSIFSRSDGVVAWQCSVEEAGPMSESIEVRASHLGLGVNPLALYALADRLAQPEGAWRPFDRSGARRLLYPDPQRSR
jgi:pimeloyl-ACP methyl ester carboxylesterase